MGKLYQKENPFATAKQNSANRLGGPSKALDTALGYNWGDITQNRHEYLHKARSYMAALLTKRGILNNVRKNTLIERALTMAEEREELGDRYKLMRCFGAVWRNYKRETKAGGQKTPQVERMLWEEEKKSGNGSEPLTNPKPVSAEELAALMAKGRAAYNKLKQDAKSIPEQETTVTDLTDELTAVADEQAAQDKPAGITDAMIDEHELDPKQIRYAIPAHLDKTYGKGKGGLHVRHIFGAAGFDTWYGEHENDSRKAWRLVLQYELKNPPLPELRDETEKQPKNSNAKKPSNLPAVENEGPTTAPKANEPIAGEISPSEPAKPEIVSKPQSDIPVPSPLLISLKTLTGIPVTQITQFMNKKHDQKYYKQIKAKNGDSHWTDIDPVAVRKRFEKVFGPHGLGWRIVPAQGGGQVICTPYTQKTNAGKDRQMYAVSMCSFVFEYALVTADGLIQYVQSSALSDADDNDDMGYAHRGAFTGLMKQALKMFGGYDHFIDKAA